MILSDPRASLIARKYLTRFAERRHEVLAAGARLKTGGERQPRPRLHFPRWRAPLDTANLEDTIDRISRFQGFHIGRYDIRYASEEDLRRGENFQIVELNGAASEATNIYDARNSLGKAYRTLFAQWRLVFAIGDMNRRRVSRPSRFASSGGSGANIRARPYLIRSRIKCALSLFFRLLVAFALR